MKRSISTAAAAFALIVTLTGCGASGVASPPSESEDSVQVAEESGYSVPNTKVFEQPLPDGRKMLCVWAEGYREGSISCDWESLATTEEGGVE